MCKPIENMKVDNAVITHVLRIILGAYKRIITKTYT